MIFSLLAFFDFNVTMDEYIGTRVMVKRKKVRKVSERILYIVNIDGLPSLMNALYETVKYSYHLLHDHN